MRQGPCCLIRRWYFDVPNGLTGYGIEGIKGLNRWFKGTVDVPPVWFSSWREYIVSKTYLFLQYVYSSQNLWQSISWICLVGYSWCSQWEICHDWGICRVTGTYYICWGPLSKCKKMVVGAPEHILKQHSCWSEKPACGNATKQNRSSWCTIVHRDPYANGDTTSNWLI